jgi:DNA-binding IclR family transcriptional regulator
MNVGARLPLFHSAIGRAVLVAMSAEERGHLVQLGIAEKPEDAARIRASVDVALESHAGYGFTTSFGDWRREVNGIAVPVVSLNGDRIYGMNIGGPSFLVSPETLIDAYGSRLIAAGKALSGDVQKGAA